MLIDIPLLLESIDIYEMDDLLKKHFFKEESIDWDAKCENSACKLKAKHSKTSRFTKLPQILIITFQRYNYRSKRKNSSKIYFKQSIDMAKFCDSDCFDSKQNTKYNLYAVSNHIGSLDMGHYFAYCKIDNSWYEFNDSSVTKYYRC